MTYPLYQVDQGYLFDTPEGEVWFSLDRWERESETVTVWTAPPISSLHEVLPRHRHSNMLGTLQLAREEWEMVLSC